MGHQRGVLDAPPAPKAAKGAAIRMPGAERLSVAPLRLAHLCRRYDRSSSFWCNRLWRGWGRLVSVGDTSCVTQACTTLASSTTPAGSVSSLTLEGEPAEESSTPPSQRCIASVIEGRSPRITAPATARACCSWFRTPFYATGCSEPASTLSPLPDLAWPSSSSRTPRERMVITSDA